MRHINGLSTVSILIISFVILSSLVTPVYCVSVSYLSGGGGGGGTATISGKYNLDRSAYLHETARFGSGEVFQGRTVAGTGENSLSQQVSGSGYKVENEIVSVGALSASTSVAASADRASLNQEIAGGGNLGVSVQGSQGSIASGQEAAVLGGVISTSQSLTAGDGVASGQSTAMAGAAGYVSSGALSDENMMALAGSFLGDGDMTAALSTTTSASGDRARIGGEVSIYGAKWFDDRDLEMVASENGGVSVSGLQALEDGGVGSFGLSAENTNTDVLAMVDASGERKEASGGDMVSTSYQGGSYSSYALLNYRWNQQNPQIQLYLKNDANLANEGLSAQQAQAAISSAANTWDSAVAQNLFADGETVKIDPYKNTDNVYDGYNVHGWKEFSGDASNAIGYARTRYGGQIVDGYYSVLESDVSYNTRYGWSTDLNNLNGKFDVESVALHELGHTIGLGDLYTLPDSDPRRHDYEQIMNLYDAPQRYLGNGDKTGAQLLYGRPDGKIPLYRMYSPIVLDHFYTTNYNEYATGAVRVGYLQEGITGYIYPYQQDGLVPLYRMYSPIVLDHFYTTNYNEYATGAVQVGYLQEGIAGYVYPYQQDGLVPLYRMYSPIVLDHFYTTNYNEYATGAVQVGYLQEGVISYL